MRPTLLEHFKLGFDSFFFSEKRKVSLCKIALSNTLRSTANPVIICVSWSSVSVARKMLYKCTKGILMHRCTNNHFLEAIANLFVWKKHPCS